jgi:hypothetical protein
MPQMLEASILGKGVVKDVKFPNVNPSASRDEVATMAMDLIEEISLQLDSDEHNYVLIQGEMTLVHAVVLHYMGAPNVTCVAATSERNTIEHEDGSKTFSFEFNQFRPY